MVSTGRKTDRQAPERDVHDFVAAEVSALDRHQTLQRRRLGFTGLTRLQRSYRHTNKQSCKFFHRVLFFSSNNKRTADEVGVCARDAQRLLVLDKEVLVMRIALTGLRQLVRLQKHVTLCASVVRQRCIAACL